MICAKFVIIYFFLLFWYCFRFAEVELYLKSCANRNFLSYVKLKWKNYKNDRILENSSEAARWCLSEHHHILLRFVVSHLRYSNGFHLHGRWKHWTCRFWRENTFQCITSMTRQKFKWVNSLKIVYNFEKLNPPPWITRKFQRYRWRFNE